MHKVKNIAFHFQPLRLGLSIPYLRFGLVFSHANTKLIAGPHIPFCLRVAFVSRNLRQPETFYGVFCIAVFALTVVKGQLKGLQHCQHWRRGS